jgi:hypothetical protein
MLQSALYAAESIEIKNVNLFAVRINQAVPL